METFGFGEDPWFDLWDYIASESEFRLVKGLRRSLCEIRGMKMESKMVLSRISGTLERNVNEELRVLSGLDWLNQP